MISSPVWMFCFSETGVPKQLSILGTFAGKPTFPQLQYASTICVELSEKSRNRPPVGGNARVAAVIRNLREATAFE